mmetsp:Transcript_16710/g.42304  ORF Transcript_16710/g.42304 Transcript_16710/m.42304 type:complete len:239 (-) Transcript_16710:115-831(-)
MLAGHNWLRGDLAAGSAASMDLRSLCVWLHLVAGVAAQGWQRVVDLRLSLARAHDGRNTLAQAQVSLEHRCRDGGVVADTGGCRHRRLGVLHQRIQALPRAVQRRHGLTRLRRCPLAMDGLHLVHRARRLAEHVTQLQVLHPQHLQLSGEGQLLLQRDTSQAPAAATRLPKPALQLALRLRGCQLSLQRIDAVLLPHNQHGAHMVGFAPSRAQRSPVPLLQPRQPPALPLLPHFIQHK